MNNISNYNLKVWHVFCWYITKANLRREKMAAAVKTQSRSKSIFDSYLNDISRKPLLKKEEEYGIAVRIITLQQDIVKVEKQLFNKTSGNVRDKKKLEKLHHQLERAVSEMMEGNYRLVISVAKKYSNNFHQLSDLVEEGNLGLLCAIRKFDPFRGNRFSTFAIPWIKQSISKAIREKSRMIRVPVHIDRTVSSYKKLVSSYQQTESKLPAYKTIKKYFDISEGRMTYYLNIADHTVSLNRKAPEMDKELEECVADEEHRFCPQKEMIRKSLKDSLLRILNCLKEKEKKVIIMRYGLFGSRKLTLDVIGKLLDLTRERVRQIQMDALENLKNQENISELRYFLN